MKIEKKYFLLIILIICLLTAGVGCGKPANTSSKTNKSTKNEITQSNSDSNNTASINSTSASDNNVAAPNNTVNSSTEVAAVNNSSNQSNTSSTSKNNTVQQSSQAVKSDTQQSQSSTTAAGNTQSTVPKAAPPTAQTFTGFITTEDDFAANLREDTAFMIYMRLMALSGLGITIQQNGQWVFYYFDGNISTDNKEADGKWDFNGTNSQLTAWNIVEAQVKENNGANKMNPVPVIVTGILSGNTKTNPGLDVDGKQFPVITVKSITKN